eukprot:g1805.t1
MSHHTQKARPIGAVSVEPEAKHESKREEEEKFNWFKNWYAVQAVENLPTDRPYPIELLGKYYVVWKGHSGDWIAMDDECPHRMAPLSEGRIEKDGNLLCSYHAWRFNESGKCVKIPHAEDEKAHSVACNSPRSSVQTYPCKTRGGILWIWPDKSTNVFSDSEKVSVPMEDRLADFVERSTENGTLSIYVLKADYSFVALMENIIDPSHFDSLHHKAVPVFNRYQVGPINGRLLETTDDKPPRITSMNFTMPPSIPKGRIDLLFPGSCLYSVGQKEGEHDELTYLSCSPINKGRSIVHLLAAKTSDISNPKKPNFIQRALGPILNVLIHFLYLELSVADNVMLMFQDRNTGMKSGETSRHYYTPTSGDLLAVEFRRWFETQGESGAAYGGNQVEDQTTSPTKEQLFDRYEQHTKDCKLCRNALKTVETAISVLKFVRNASLFIGAALILRSYEAGSVQVSMLKNLPIVCSVLILLLSSVLVYLLNKLRRLFVYIEYDFSRLD